MEIAILSDSHDHIWNLEKVLKQIKGKAEAIIHCGDIIAPFTVELLASAHLSTYICFGNNVDQDQMAVIKKANDKFEWVPIAKENGEISVNFVAGGGYAGLKGCKQDKQENLFEIAVRN